eukprot:5078045-Prymnesium_polylepis.1
MTDERSVSSCESCDEARSWRLAALGGAPGVEKPARGRRAQHCDDVEVQVDCACVSICYVDGNTVRRCTALSRHVSK